MLTSYWSISNTSFAKSVDCLREPLSKWLVVVVPVCVCVGRGRGGEGRWRVQFSKVKLNGILVILFLLLFCCCCCCFFLFGEFLLFTISHTKKVNKPFVVLRVGGGTSKIRQVYDTKKKATSIKWPPSAYR